MKQSLRKAISLFSFPEQAAIFRALLNRKLKRRMPAKSATLFECCINYVRIIEKGVTLVKAHHNLLKASVSINQKPVSIFIRKNSSDLEVFESVILEEEYKIAKDRISVDDRKHERTIIDAGGNIGLTSIYFYCFYPDSRFFIIEPDEKNYTQLQMNLEENNISSATLFKKALWITNEKLVIDNSFRDGKEWSITVGKAENKTVDEGAGFIEGISLQEICAVSNIEHIDLLKIDIEGAERFLFTDASFLDTAGNLASNIVIEIHDEFNIRETINLQMQQRRFSQMEDKDLTLYSK